MDSDWILQENLATPLPFMEDHTSLLALTKKIPLEAVCENLHSKRSHDHVSNSHEKTMGYDH
ncbi:hypothetical protein OUZ56_009834 [Daphnia magna]|uniref:Uncharacterized protein n=1 Tax=Daphnia magna TaxID=35525 RepID=A0ABR0AH12_9CRUS|nr:hypothetical protein OUZ56_009834 [Daphnia magna]